MRSDWGKSKCIKYSLDGEHDGRGAQIDTVSGTDVVCRISTYLDPPCMGWKHGRNGIPNLSTASARERRVRHKHTYTLPPYLPTSLPAIILPSIPSLLNPLQFLNRPLLYTHRQLRSFADLHRTDKHRSFPSAEACLVRSLPGRVRWVQAPIRPYKPVFPGRVGADSILRYVDSYTLSFSGKA